MKKINLDRARPQDADKLQAVEPVICYNPSTLENYDFTIYEAVRHTMKKINSELIPPRSASCINVNAGQFFRIKSVDGPQVGDLNLWSREELSEFFYSGKTRALYGTHVSTKRSSLVKFTHNATYGYDNARYVRLVRL